MPNPVSNQPGAAQTVLMKALGPAGATSTGSGAPSGTLYSLTAGSTFQAHPDDVTWFLRTGAASIVTTGAGSSVAGQNILMRHPLGIGCSWGGVTYTVNGSQQVQVPFQAAADLQALGFAPVGQVAAP